MLRLSLAALAAVLILAAPAAAAPYDDDAYWAFADRMQQRVDRHWDEDAGYFRLGGGGVEPMANSMQLLTYSVAAMQGHEGPSRNDHRARLLADRLVSAPPFVTAKTGSGQVHAPGWVNSMTSRAGGQHLVFDAEVVDGLVYAYRAREALNLPGRDRDQDPRRDPSHRPRLVLALPDDPPQPGQLVRADVRRRRHRHRRQHPAQARYVPAAQALLRRRPRQRRPRGQLRPGHALPLPARHLGQREDERRLRRVREHRPDLHALLRPGAARRDAGRSPAPRSPSCTSGSRAPSPATGPTPAT